MTFNKYVKKAWILNGRYPEPYCIEWRLSNLQHNVLDTRNIRNTRNIHANLFSCVTTTQTWKYWLS